MKADTWSLDNRLPPKTFRERCRRFVEGGLPTVVFFLMVLALVAVVLAPRVIVTVPSGEVGVLWKRFHDGTVLDPRELKEEGIHFILPWDKVFIYNLRVQSVTETYNAISSDGVNMNATINTRFRLQHDSIPTLHQVVGPDYIKLLGPQIASVMREVVAEFTAEQVYSTARQQIQDKIRERALETLGHKMMERETDERSYNVAMRDTVVLYDTLLYGIELPPTVVNAINRKAEQYYIAEEYNFRLTREKKESERKRIEAEGIRDFQQIVSKGISDSYLRWRGVEATLQLAQSTNTKVVIIGAGKDGLPIILGNADGGPPAAAPRGDDEAAPKKTTTATGPTVPLEKMRGSALATPGETVPVADTAKPAEKPSAGQETSPAAAKSQGILGLGVPFSFSDLASFYMRYVRPTRPWDHPAEDASGPAAGTKQQ
jgi:regulator of protease activity HflC (stomatin/prohibitin superfamily)